MQNLVIYCADIGSIPQGNFAWARAQWSRDRFVLDPPEQARHGSIVELSRRVGVDLDADVKVALGFECPLFVPIGKVEMANPCAARPGEGSHAWSGGPGATVLATGIGQVLFVLERLRRDGIGAFVEWEGFTRTDHGLFLWEAFVTGEAKSQREGWGGHFEDAGIGALAFAARVSTRVWSNINMPDDDDCHRAVHSLLGAALLRTGWTTDLGVLQQQCVVVKPE